MKSLSSEFFGGLIGVLCVGVFATYAFVYSGNAEASRAADVPVVQAMPSATEFVVAERRLLKATRDSRFAKSCVRGQILGGTEVHIGMNFVPLDRPATAKRPGLARAHAEKANGPAKALVLESKDPTVWTVTGAPSAIILLGQAVISDYPEGTPIFAPRFAKGCEGARWADLPKNWDLPLNQNVMDSMVDNLEGRFGRRAALLAEKMFDRPVTSWSAQRGELTMRF